MTADAVSAKGPSNVSGLVEYLQQVLTLEGRPVTSRWLCYEHACTAADAQVALQQCVEQAGSKVNATYLVVGRSRDGEHRAQLVAAERLHEVQSTMCNGANSTVYALAPRRSPLTALCLHVQDLEQANKFVKEVIGGQPSLKAQAYARNQSSYIRTDNCRRVECQSGPPDSTPGPLSAPAQPTVAAVDGRRPRAASAPAASVPPIKQESDANEDDTNVKPLLEVPLEVKGILGTAFGKAAKTATKQAGNLKALKDEDESGQRASGAAPACSEFNGERQQQEATAGTPKTARQVLDDEAEDDENGMDTGPPLRVRKPGAVRSRALLCEDSDDDFMQSTSPTKAAHTFKAAKPLAVHKSRNQLPDGVEVPSKRAFNQQASKPCEDKLARGSEAADITDATAEFATDVADVVHTPGPRHPVYGQPPVVDAEIRMIGGKAFWEYIDDKGQEVTVAATRAGASENGYAGPVKTDHKAAVNSPEKLLSKDSKVKKGAKPAKQLAGFGDLRAMFKKK